MRIGLAISVGSLKAAAAGLGVYKAILDTRHEVRAVAGASGGSIVTPLIANLVKPGDIDSFFKTIKGRKIYDQDVTQQFIDFLRRKIFIPRRKDPPFTGLIRGNYIYDQLKRMYKKFNCENIEDIRHPAKIVATKIASKAKENPHILQLAAIKDDSRYEEVFTSGKTRDAVRSSIAIPIVFRPHIVSGNMYVDGGAVNHLPLDKIVDEDVDAFIAVSVLRSIYEGVSFETDDVDTLFEVGVATLYAAVKDSTEIRLSKAIQKIRKMNKPLIMLEFSPKIKMHETEKIKDVSDEIADVASGIIAKQIGKGYF